MVEKILVDQNALKALKYEQLIPQINALIGDEKRAASVLYNAAAAIHQAFDLLWTGFYLKDGNVLYLGPFQDLVACIKINVGNGVCGSAMAKNGTIVVPDVDQFQDHTTCSTLSKLEILAPIRYIAGEVFAVLDLDSATLSNFGQVDRDYLEQICDWLGGYIFSE